MVLQLVLQCDRGESGTIKLLHLDTLVPSLLFEQKADFAMEKTMGQEECCTLSGRCPLNIVRIPLTNDNKGDLVPVVKLWVSPGCLITGLLLEGCVGDDKLPGSAEQQQEGAI